MIAAVADRSLTYVVLRDFRTTAGGSLQNFRTGQRLSEISDMHMIQALIAEGSPIEAEGERTMDTCPRCGHVYACGLER